jgi:hypothetical protein
MGVNNESIVSDLVLKVGHDIGARQILCRNGLCDQMKSEVRQGDSRSDEPRRKSSKSSPA